MPVNRINRLMRTTLTFGGSITRMQFAHLLDAIAHDKAGYTVIDSPKSRWDTGPVDDETARDWYAAKLEEAAADKRPAILCLPEDDNFNTDPCDPEGFELVTPTLDTLGLTWRVASPPHQDVYDNWWDGVVYLGGPESLKERGSTAVSMDGTPLVEVQEGDWMDPVSLAQEALRAWVVVNWEIPPPDIGRHRLLAR